MIKQYDEMKAAHDKMQARVFELEAQLFKMRDTLSRSEDTAKEQRKTIRLLQRQIIDNGYGDVTEVIEWFVREFRVKHRAIAKANGAVKKLRRALKELRDENHELNAALGAAAKKIEQLELRCESGYERHRATSKRLQEVEHDRDDHIVGMREEAKKYKEKLREAAEQHAKDCIALDEAAKRIEELEHDREIDTERIAILEERLQQANQVRDDHIEGLQRYKASHDHLLDDAANRLDELETQNQRLRTALERWVKKTGLSHLSAVTIVKQTVAGRIR